MGYKCERFIEFLVANSRNSTTDSHFSSISDSSFLFKMVNSPKTRMSYTIQRKLQVVDQHRALYRSNAAETSRKTGINAKQILDWAKPETYAELQSMEGKRTAKHLHHNRTALDQADGVCAALR